MAQSKNKLLLITTIFWMLSNKSLTKVAIPSISILLRWIEMDVEETGKENPEEKAKSLLACDPVTRVVIITIIITGNKVITSL